MKIVFLTLLAALTAVVVSSVMWVAVTVLSMMTFSAVGVDLQPALAATFGGIFVLAFEALTVVIAEEML